MEEQPNDALRKESRMTYPPLPHRERDTAAMAALVKARPFAHLITSNPRLLVTRLPFALDLDGGQLKRLRSHMNALNPQADELDGAETLIAFSGPDSFVSPNWRLKGDRGATWDYTAVHIWGRATVRPERDFFATLVDDLARMEEEKHRGASSKPDWTFSNAAPDYVDRLHPKLTAFEVEIERVEAISKLHQDFPERDALSVAEHLDKSPDAQSGAIADLIRSKRNFPTG